MQNIKVSKDCYIPKDNIKLYIAYDSNAVRKDVRIKRKQGLIYDYISDWLSDMSGWLHDGFEIVE